MYFWLFDILKVDRMMSFCNIFMEHPHTQNLDHYYPSQRGDAYDTREHISCQFPCSEVKLEFTGRSTYSTCYMSTSVSVLLSWTSY